ncbi:unnamed protein product [Haemonchus placei]|uniref:RNase_PH domain-containing protein n=1 Tax=Haemonchus placei TaxID=6290 RepID=A0A0N4WLT5_HAEPC|nr:unnamed protein product [Haemonchus placei]
MSDYTGAKSDSGHFDDDCLSVSLINSIVKLIRPLKGPKEIKLRVDIHTKSRTGAILAYNVALIDVDVSMMTFGIGVCSVALVLIIGRRSSDRCPVRGAGLISSIHCCPLPSAEVPNNTRLVVVVIPEIIDSLLTTEEGSIKGGRH